MKRISVKLALLIILIISLSSILSIMISAFFGFNFKKEIMDNQFAMRDAAIILMDEHDLSIDEIETVLTNTVFLMTVEENLNALEPTKVAENALQKEGTYYCSGTWNELPYTLFESGGYYFKISFDGHATLMKTVISRMGFTALSYIVVGILLTLLIVRKMVKPLLNLTEATKEVAKGNFDIQVKSKGRDEITVLTENFNQMTRELQNIEVLRKDFISNFSHEFKTPLASIQGFAKLLGQDTISPEDQKEYAAIIVEETQRLSHLSSNILKLSKLENQEIITRHTPFSLDEQMRHSILLLEREWSEKKLILNLEFEDVQINSDEALLSQVWINLLENAIKFSSDHQQLSVSIKKYNHTAEVIISDQGLGMNEETKRRIFEKFYQGDVQHSEVGNGLGLALVKRIIDLHQGEITVTSELNKGTSFKINLPLG